MSVVRFERSTAPAGAPESALWFRATGPVPENPTDSDIWTVLEHERGGVEVWDCGAFGPWKLVAGPFAGPTGYAQACAALAVLR